jgi:peroxisomal membrane protein 2
MWIVILGTLTFLQEILGSHLAGVPVARPSKHASAITHLLAAAHIDLKALKMGAYGAFVAAPMSHYLVGTLQKFFAGKTSAAARAAQILASNIFIAPLQTIGDFTPGAWCDTYSSKLVLF